MWFSVLDFILSEFDFDGFHLESGDQGRCHCAECGRQGDIEYHSRLNERAARYLRQVAPSATILVNMCGQMWSGKPFSEDDVEHLRRLGRTIDCLIDPGHAGPIVPPETRRVLIRDAGCRFGTSGDLWVYPPQYWDRLRWFLPHPRRTAEHLRRLHAEGGRAAELYMGPTSNPGVELNIACGGELLNNVGHPIEDVLAEVVEVLYLPHDAHTRKALVRLILQAEEAYFGRWSAARITGETALDQQLAGWAWQGNHGPVPGELHLTFLEGAAPEVASYLAQPFLDADALAGYRQDLVAMLTDLALRGWIA